MWIHTNKTTQEGQLTFDELSDPHCNATIAKNFVPVEKIVSVVFKCELTG